VVQAKTLYKKRQKKIQQEAKMSHDIFWVSTVKASFSELEKIEVDEKDKQLLVEMQQTLAEIFTTGSYTRATRLLWSYFRKFNNNDLRLAIADLIDKIKIGSRQVLEDKAREYFESQFTGCTVEFHNKTSGVRFGTIAHVTHGDNMMKFYIKTHRNGLATQSSGTIKPVDLSEVFLYKLLEYAGAGPEVHFFYNDEKDFYICTRDATEHFNATWWLLSQMKENESTNHIVESIRQMNADNETNLLNDNIDRVMLGFSQADMLCHIFDMTDVLKNDGNFGFILDSNNAILRLCVVDFSVNITVNSGTEKYNRFLQGNGVFLYNMNDMYRYLLCQRDVENRRELARRAWNSFRANLKDAVQKAQEFISEYFNQHKSKLRHVDFASSQSLFNKWSEDLMVFEKLLFE
jgi:hypothetical protein